MYRIFYIVYLKLHVGIQSCSFIHQKINTIIQFGMNIMLTFSHILISSSLSPEIRVSVSPGEASVNESQGSVEVCLEANGELEMGTEIVIVLSTSNITASGTYTN